MKTRCDLDFGRPYSAAPSDGRTITIPKGTTVIHAGGMYWINPADPFFDGKPILKHDADSHGFHVQDADVEKE